MWTCCWGAIQGQRSEQSSRCRKRSFQGVYTRVSDAVDPGNTKTVQLQSHPGWRKLLRKSPVTEGTKNKNNSNFYWIFQEEFTARKKYSNTIFSLGQIAHDPLILFHQNLKIIESDKNLKRFIFHWHKKKWLMDIFKWEFDEKYY